MRYAIRYSEYGACVVQDPSGPYATYAEAHDFIVASRPEHMRGRPTATPMFGTWTALADFTPPSGVYLFYHPEAEVQGCRYAESMDIAFWDADDRISRGGYHGPVPPTHFMPKPGRPT